MTTMATHTPMSLRLDQAVRDRLSGLAKRQKRSSHALALEAIEAYIAQKELETARNQEALAAWKHYQETGLHVTGEEVIAWLETWGTENELPPPQCHV
jgi:predicted transcriptional regulator